MRIVAWVVVWVGMALACLGRADAAILYTVAPHDTLYSIARRFGVPVSRLIEANDLRDASKLRVGQVLTIPDGGASTARPAAAGAGASGGPWGLEAPSPAMWGPQGERGVPEPAPGPLATPPAPRAPEPAEAAGETYVVRPGDTLYHVATTHGISVAELRQANGLGPSDTLHVDQILVIHGGGHPAADTPPPIVPPASAPPASAGPLPNAGGPYGGALTLPDRATPGAPAPATQTPLRMTLLARRAVADALGYLGTPYVWGGSSRAGVDCSGLVYLVYAPYVPNLPRLSYDQWGAGVAVDSSNLEPGDLVFFDTDGTGASHVGIYIGGGQFVHPSSSAHRVVVDNLDEPYYLSHYLGARRIL